MKGKRATIVEVDATITLHNRIPLEDLKHMEEWARTGAHPNIGSNYGLHLVSGRIVVPQQWFPRLDIAMLQYYGLCNVFIDCDGTTQIDKWNNVIEIDEDQIQKDVESFWLTNKVYINQQYSFVSQWKTILRQLDGLTPTEALEVMAKLGFKEA